MKLKTLYLVFALMAGMIQSAMADQAFRDHRYDSWKVMQLPANAIVFVGNSITDMHLWSEAFGNDPRVVNRGNSGGYSFEVLDNVESWVRFKPAKVFIKIGTNDLGTGYKENSIADNIRKTVDIIRRESPQTEIYLQSILPARDQSYRTLATIEAANDLIKNIADDNEKTIYIDLYSQLGGIRTGEPYSLDNLHLEAYGYKIWTEAIKDYVGITPIYPETTETIQNNASLATSQGMRATYFSVLPTKSSDILFFGDEMVKNGEWNELLHNQNVKNRGSWWGYGGNIAAVSNFVDAAFANKDNGVTRETPAKILLYTATEDVNGSTDLETVESNYAELIAKIKTYSPATPIGVVSLMPKAAADSRVTEFNAWLKTTADADDNLTYIDIYTSLANQEGKGDSRFFVGNYLYGLGYIQVARKISSFVGDCSVISDDEAIALKNMFELRTSINSACNFASSITVGTGMGQYSESAVASLFAKVENGKALLASSDASDNDIETMATELQSLVQTVKTQINLPGDNVEGKQFLLSTPLRNGLLAYSTESSAFGASINPGYASYRWIFESRGDGTFNIKNVGCESYLDPSAAHNTQIQMSSAVPTSGWTLEYAETAGLYIIRSGTTCQLNATTLSNNPIYNWFGSGNAAQNRTDDGCQWLLTDVTDVDIVKEPLPIVIKKGIAQEGAATIENGRIYTITNRQKDGTCYPLYVENATLLAGEANALASKSYGSRAQFEAIEKGTNLFAFKNVETGLYLIWRGNDSGFNSNSGLLEEYNSTYCDFKITSVSAVTNGKLLTAKRANGTDIGTFVLMSDGSWSKWSAATLGYSATYSNVFTLGDVTDGDEGEVIIEDEPLGDEWPLGMDWYTMQIGSSGLYVSNNGSADYISLTSAKTEFADADLWYRVGDDTEGYTIYNKEAGTQKVLAAPTTMSDKNGETSYPIMVDKDNVPSGYTDKWLFAQSTNLGNDVEAYYMYEKGYEANKVNNRNGKFAFWSNGADAGSSIQWKWAQRTVAVNMDNGTFTSTNSDGSWAKIWTSNATEPQLTLNAGLNNMNVENSNSTTIQAFRGGSEPQAYTISAGANYVVAAYSFDFVMSGSTAINVIDANSKSYTSSSSPQTIVCCDLTEPSTSFKLSGSNNGIDITNFLVTIQRAQRKPEPQFEIFPTPSNAAIPYRIPAIATAFDGTLVAAADYRYSRVDIGSGRIDLHIRRSHDNGKTWGEIESPAVMKGDGNTAVGHQEAGFGDPCIVGDIESPRMLLTSCSGTPGFFAGTRDHHQGWARWYSDDNGATWSEPEYLDEEFIYSKFDKSVYGPIRGWFVGSGKICQSHTTKVGDYYRLYCVGSSCRQGSNETANWALYSDDFGETWEFLGGCDYSPVPGGDEPKAEELPDGSILLSSRCNNGRNFNIFTFTDVKKAQGSWGTPAFSGSSNNGVTALNNACNGEVMLVPVTRKADNKKMFLLLQSVPFGSGRTNVGIYYKELDSLAQYRTPSALARNWTGRHQSSYISGAYSTMTWQKDNTIGFVYEEDTYGTTGGGYTIVYKNYSIEQITDSAYTYNPSVDGDSITAKTVSEVVDDLLSTKNVGKIVGQYTEAAAEQILSAYQLYVNNPTRDEYENLNYSILTAPRVVIDPTIYYTIRNYGRGSKNYLMNANTSAVFSVNVNKTDNSKWRFESSATDPDVYYVYNKKYDTSILGPTLATETRTVLVADEAEAGLFRVVSTSEGLSAFQCQNPTNTSYPYLHLSADNARIVPWVANSPSANAASFWYIEPTDDIYTSVGDISNQLDNLLSTGATKYDLQGRPFNSPQKGQIYIQNGKAYIKE